ncbi:MAG TPA: MFS transporter [Rhizomicrobium sp.]|jgi:ACS family tartrate transporter-like MFS transporter
MDERAIFAKAAWRLIPFMGLLYVVNFLDRVNVGFAALTMNKDLGLSAHEYGFGAGLFFFGYFLCEVPSNAIMMKVGARRWIFRIMLSWGLISMAMALARTPFEFYALRFLLGMAEAGFFPGMILYLTFWFPAAARARFNAAFFMSILIANVIGSPLSGALLGLGGSGSLHGWQWLFLVEGFPACILSFFVLAFLPNGPHDARWLDEEEKRIIAAALARDAKPHGTIWTGLRDPRVWVLGVADIGIIVALYGIGLWLPQIVKPMGFSNLQTGFVVAAPYAFAMVTTLAWAYSSDVRNERRWHVVIPALFASASLFATALLGASALSLLTLTAATIGIYAALVVFWTYPTSILGGTAAAASVAFVNSIGNLGGFFGPDLVGKLKDSTGNYSAGMAVLASGLIITALVVFLFARRVRVTPQG